MHVVNIPVAAGRHPAHYLEVGSYLVYLVTSLFMSICRVQIYLFKGRRKKKKEGEENSRWHYVTWVVIK